MRSDANKQNQTGIYREQSSGYHRGRGRREVEVAQSCPTLSGPMDCSLAGSSVHGIFQARVLEWGAIVLVQKHSKYGQWQS